MAPTSRSDGVLERARTAYRSRDWVRAREHFERVADDPAFGADDLHALASCAWWLGDLGRALPLQERAYRAHLDDERPVAAAVVAVDLGYTLMMRGEEARASGWVARARRLLEDRPECVEHGYLDHIDFEEAFVAGDLDAAMRAARRVGELGRRFGDVSLGALGVLGEGRVLVRRGQVRDGMALLDEAMLAAVSDDLEPAWAGNIYCHLMSACVEIADRRRAGEWTELTRRWCESMPGAGPFMGICRVHRADVLQAQGRWDDAEREVLRVRDEFEDVDVEIVAEASYLLGELRRRRTDLDGAERAYREGRELGRDPQPGLALLRLAQGQVSTAAASIRAALSAAGGDATRRARLLPAAIEVAVAEGAVEEARGWSEELSATARTYGTTGFHVDAWYSRGLVALASGEAGAAIGPLREAMATARDLEAAYDVARIRRSLARAYVEVGDEEAAAVERAAADTLLEELGAQDGSDARARGSARSPDRAPRTGVSVRGRVVGELTQREREVVALVATGRSNQQIADELVLSVRTVERHLASTYEKLGLHGRSARAGAVSIALREGILDPR